MRILLFILIGLGISNVFGQTPGTALLSAIVVGPDSIPVPGVAIINARTGHTVRTNQKGFFQTEIAADDSVFIYHISYKRQFASQNDNGKIIVLEPQINELKQVNVTDNAIQEMRALQQTVNDIKRMAPKKKAMDTISARQQMFIDQNGSFHKGFKPFFGPTIHIPLEKMVASLAGNEDKRERKKLTSHYHLVKKKDNE
ncbi:MAG TPA: hypothetical protein DCL77_21535 [Prolixibacteraceae bacterium]|jgi:hypothetical protein|nr:hypothetical protein [Prolixibacteraceae bacterium]